MSSWVWEEVDVDRSGSSGDVSKLFKNEGVKCPGVLSQDAPPSDATLLAREAIQNSWDAGRALADELLSEGREAPRFRMRFVYRRYVGDEKHRIVAASALHELGLRASLHDRRELGLSEHDCLLHLDDADTPLNVLLVEESGTTGMGGPWRGAASKLYLALVSVGFTVKAQGAGGSYGYGKAGLIRTSSIRTVFAHTCFREQADDKGISRRLLGMTYWGQHSSADASFTGFARHGQTLSGKVRPRKNEEADAVAAKLGLRIRDPALIEDLGSTFLLFDPIVAAEDLCRAIERNWWPAIESDRIDLEVETADGEVLYPRPRRDEVLRSFIRGYELATEPQDNRLDNEFKRSLKPYQPAGSRQYQLGDLGLVADLDSWSYADNSRDVDSGNDIDHQSLVALVRGPHMVVEYLPISGGQPYVRGTFVAHDDVDDLLRQTEPKAHDAWQPKLEEEGIDPDAPKVAYQVLRRIREHVRAFRRQLTPPSPRERDIRLPLLDDLFRGILDNRGHRHAPPPPPDPRPISIRMCFQQPEVVDSGRVRMHAKVQFELSDHHQGDAAEARLVFRYVFDEDGALGESCPLSIVTSPPEFHLDSQDDSGIAVVGLLAREPATFEILSDPYHADWTGQLIVAGDVVEPAAASGNGELVR